MNQSITCALDLITQIENSGIEINAPVDVEWIAREFLNIKVETNVSLDTKKIVGEIIFEGAGNPVIRVNPVKNSYLPRRRFTIAHEIGHFCLHSSKTGEGFIDSMKTMSRTESYWDVKESEANAFAAQLLMPKHLILNEGDAILDEYIYQNNGAMMKVDMFIEKMARIFNVSSKAMTYRLENLGVIS